MEYFHIERLGHVYEKLSDPKQAEQWKQKFIESDGYRRYVISRLSAPCETTPGDDRRDESHTWKTYAATLKHQLPILASRYWRVFMMDRRALASLTLQCLVVAVLLWLVFGNITDTTDPFRRAVLSSNVLFVMGISSLWFGCNNSAKEIVKERGIYTKEMQVNLDAGSYYASKYLLQFVVASLQSVVMFLLVSTFCRLPGNMLAQSLCLVLVAAAGVAIGLFLSAVSKTEEMALALVPLVLIPQIILADVFFELKGFSKLLGMALAANYWACGLLRGYLPTELLEQLNPPLASCLVNGTAQVVLALHIVVLVAGAIVVLHVRDRMMPSSKKSFFEALGELLRWKM